MGREARLFGILSVKSIEVECSDFFHICSLLVTQLLARYGANRV